VALAGNIPAPHSTDGPPGPATDRLQIAELLQNWVVWRDSGRWDRFRTVWHPDARMMATWFQGPAEEFVRMSIAGWERGVSILHFLGGISIDLESSRAIAQTKMTISQRGEVEGVACDITCTGRFYDFVEKRDGVWRILMRQPIYEKDSCIPVDPSARPKLDSELLNRFPIGYRHLAYVQTLLGYTVRTDLPGQRGERVEALYALGAAWLAGGSLDAWT
jgi:hypothetical protein